MCRRQKIPRAFGDLYPAAWTEGMVGFGVKLREVLDTSRKETSVDEVVFVLSERPGVVVSARAVRV